MVESLPKFVEIKKKKLLSLNSMKLAVCGYFTLQKYQCLN